MDSGESLKPEPSTSTLVPAELYRVGPADSRAGVVAVPLLLCLSRCDYGDDGDDNAGAVDDDVVVLTWS